MADMNKLEKLRQLHEKGLREEVLLPLLTRLGYSAPTIYHGSRERGKDIITYRDHPLGHREYLAVVAKSVDLNWKWQAEKDSPPLAEATGLQGPFCVVVTAVEMGVR